MKKVYILYNPKSGNGTGETQGKKLTDNEGRELVFYDITGLENYADFFNGLNEGDCVIVAGGDGTLSRFANDIAQLDIKNDIYYYATGSGNDFLNDRGHKKGDKPFLINEYMKNLPVMDINGIKTRFVNCAGGGLDAYSCAESNRIHEKGKKSNYVATALKGIFYDYKPMNAHLVIDGKAYDFKNVWFASVMKGKYLGGGIMLAPKQERMSGKLSVVVVHKVGKLGLLPIIPRAYKGNHVKYTEYVTVLEGYNVSVSFDRPVPIQIDGETVGDTTLIGVQTETAVV